MVMAMRRAITVMLAAVALGSCGGGGGGNDGVPVVQVFGDAQELAVYRAVAKAYEKKTGKRVRLSETPDRDSHLAKLTTGFAARRPADVFLLNYRNFGPFVSKGVLDPVGAHVDPAGYFPAALDAFTWKGVLTCVPQSASSVVVYLNLDRLAAAGVEPPEDGWTFDQFLRLGIKLRESLSVESPDGTVRALGIDPSLIRLAPFIWSAGGELVDDLADPKHFAFDTPQARRGIDRFLALYREALVPREIDVEAKALGDRFLDGELAMYMSSRRETGVFRSITGFKWDVAPFPHAERGGGVLQSDAYCVAKSARSAAAWDFVAFAAGPEGQRMLARAGRVVPSLRSVAASPDFLAPGKAPASAQVFVDAAENLRRLPNTENWPRIEDAASLAFKRAYYIEMTVDQAIARIDNETKDVF
jgi:multiple sugar transport system substrate-binding protein